jgi:hypothetical protein
MSVNKSLFLSIAALSVAYILHPCSAAPVAASQASLQRASTDTYPYAGQSGFNVTGKISSVDSDNDQLTVVTDDGTTYTIDTRGAQFKLRVQDPSADIDDLTRDMRVHITGNLLSGNLIAANQVDVLPAVGAHSLPFKATTPSEQRLPISLLGTVVNVDNAEGSFDVHIKSHERTIYVSSETRFPNIFVPGRNIPLNPGDRVSVEGKLETDGTVSAAIVRLSQSIHTVHQLIGKVTTESSPLYSRDLRIRLDSGPVIIIKVPKDTTINRGDDEVSVHTLTTDDVLRIQGAFDGDDFVATQIDVLQPEVSASN